MRRRSRPASGTRASTPARDGSHDRAHVPPITRRPFASKRSRKERSSTRPWPGPDASSTRARPTRRPPPWTGSRGPRRRRSSGRVASGMPPWQHGVQLLRVEPLRARRFFIITRFSSRRVRAQGHRGYARDGAPSMRCLRCSTRDKGSSSVLSNPHCTSRTSWPAEIAAEAGAVLVVDNTFPPRLSPPLDTVPTWSALGDEVPLRSRDTVCGVVAGADLTNPIRTSWTRSARHRARSTRGSSRAASGRCRSGWRFTPATPSGSPRSSTDDRRWSS